MNSVLIAVEGIFQNIPLPLLEVWGRFGFITGIGLAICAYSGITFRPGSHWGLGIQRYSWNSKALLSMAITFSLVVLCGYIGSSIVIVPGAQTFESLKDLAVIASLLIFGYPALVVIPLAYGLSDLIEGVPPEFMRDWWGGYFINPACFWIATQLIGKCPDFKRKRTWKLYLIFVAIFMTIEPPMWGYLCSDQFTPKLSYRIVTTALLFTTTITWILTPLAMLGLLPLAKKFHLFWAEIPMHVRERVISSRTYIWESGRPARLHVSNYENEGVWEGMPLRIFLVLPFIVLILIMVATTAYLTLRSSEKSAYDIASTLQQEALTGLQLKLDTLDKPSQIQGVLASSAIAQYGRAFLIDTDHPSHSYLSQLTSSSKSAPQSDPVVKATLQNMAERGIDLMTLREAVEFRFDVIVAKPLTRETWLAMAAPYGPSSVLITALPEGYFLKGMQLASSRTATILALALSLSLVAAWFVSTKVTAPIKLLSEAATAIAGGRLSQRVPCSRLSELGSLSTVFNYMANQLQKSFDDVHESEGRLNLAVNAASLGIWDWDIPRNVLVWDDGMFRQYGVGPDQFHFSFADWEQRVHPDDRAHAKEDIDRALRGECDFDSEFRVVWPDGSIHYIKGLAKTVRASDGQPRRMVGVNFDITQRKISELELQKSRDEALRSYNVKSEFLANMSHEIRTPLNSILGNANLLNETEMSEYQKSLVNVLIKSGDHLLTLINDILDLTMLESKGLTLAPAPFDLLDLASSSVELLKAHAIRKGLTLRAELPQLNKLYVVGDSHRLRQVILNLLQNAVKFTSSGEVVLKIEKTKNPAHPNELRFAVRDTGIGIPNDKLAAVFERFTQGNSSITKRFGGSGLGLSISRHLVELMGSTIKVESVEGLGTTFSFAIYLEPAAAPVEQTAPQPANTTVISSLTSISTYESDPIKILAVDDSEDNLMLLRNYMRNTNCVVEIASDGQAAVEKFRNGDFDIVLMDIQMPVMDGYTAAREIRTVEAERHLSQHIPIVALTAYALKEEERKSLDAGCDYHLAKPISKKSLLDAVAGLCEKFKIRRQPKNIGLKPALS